MERYPLIQHHSGAAAELFVASHLMETGKEVYFPVMTQSVCDFIYEGGPHSLIKAQVKKATWVKAGPHRYLQCRISRPTRAPYAATDWDVLLVTDMDRIWKFPYELVGLRPSLYLDTDNPTPRKSRRDYNPEDFLLTRRQL